METKIDVKSIINVAKKAVPQDLIFQDREYYQMPGTLYMSTMSERKRQFDLGKLVSNLDYIMKQDPTNEPKNRMLLRYFLVLIDSKKHFLDYRAFRSEILTRYRDLVDYI